HPGIVRMKAALRREYWWPCMVKQIERWSTLVPTVREVQSLADRLTALRIPSFRDREGFHVDL
ncbi:MAG: hypothetical protein GY696_34285, partial [Gammaproteobacteria bacterium]|nr:hypothetical protein [Gammaproteobacteria bacterium]